jgi:hypothetical protein
VAGQVDRPDVLMNATEARPGTKIARFIAVIRFAFSEWRQQRLMRAVELLASQYPGDNRHARFRAPDC